jgi:hypothetical protein
MSVCVRLRVSSIRRLAVGCLFLALAASAAPADKPDFSGQWKMDPAKSDFGPMPVPSKVAETIVHKEPALDVASVQVDGGTERKLEMSYRTDGTPTKGKIGENEVTNRAQWEGNVLTIESKLETPARTLTFKERWTMAEDGKSFTLARTVSTDLGDIKFVIAMVRQ